MDEFSGAALGDPRLTKRLIRLVDDLSAEPTKSIPLACGCLAETKTAYRLLDNEAVDWRAPLAAHGEPTVARMGQESRVLCVQRGSQDEAERNPGNRAAIIRYFATLHTGYFGWRGASVRLTPPNIDSTTSGELLCGRAGLARRRRAFHHLGP